MNYFLQTLKRQLRISGILLRHTLSAQFSMNASIQALRVPNLLLSPIIYIDPRNIAWAASVAVKPERGNRLFQSGDWDLSKRSMLEVETRDPKYTTCRQILHEGKGPEETDEFQMIKEAILCNGSYRGCYNSDDARAHMRARIEFYRMIAESGYKSQQELVGGSPFVGEIQCAIDRHGNLIKINAGNHRFAVARQLALKSIPVYVCLVHDSHRSIIERNGGLSALRQLIKDVEKRYA